MGATVPLVGPFADCNFISFPLSRIAAKISKGFGTFGGVAACLRFEPLSLLDDSKDVLESLETNDKEEDLGLKGGLPPTGDGTR